MKTTTTQVKALAELKSEIEENVNKRIPKTVEELTPIDKKLGGYLQHFPHYLG